ncbi:MAG: histidinol-phosphatase [Candidatus Poribacteria bacterium]|nr:MAG: histidinol-phosphatase [Candidatus Poribacteria bacterium]
MINLEVTGKGSGTQARGQEAMLLATNYHIHTHYSPCAASEMRLPAILDAAEEAGYERIGISDHCYSFDLNSYRIRDLRQELQEAAKERKIKVYLGIEAYILRHRLGSITPQIAGLFDYVLVAPNHYHIRGVAQPTRLHPRILGEHELYMFEATINSPITDVVAHPFVLSPRIFRIAPDRLAELARAMMESIDEKRLVGALRTAQSRGIAIELNPKFLRYGQTHLESFYKLCVELKVRLSFGSDAHMLDEIAPDPQIRAFVDSLELTEEHIWSPELAR